MSKKRSKLERVKTGSIKRMNDEEISDLARRIVTHEVFITNTKDGINNSFMVLLALATDSLYPVRYQLGALWEEMSQALPQSVNGYPCFSSAHFVHIDDLPILMNAIERKRKALQNA